MKTFVFGLSVLLLISFQSLAEDNSPEINLGYSSAQEALDAYRSAVHSSNRKSFEKSLNPSDKSRLKKEGVYEKWVKTMLGCEITFKNSLKPYPEFLLKAQRFKDLETQSVVTITNCGFFDVHGSITVSRYKGAWFVNSTF